MEWWVWPVGVWSSTLCRAPGSVTGLADQPGVSLVWLQASQRPWPLPAVVGPSLNHEMMWSSCRMGASQYGVRQTSSLTWMKRRSPGGKNRAFESIAIKSPVTGAV